MSVDCRLGENDDPQKGDVGSGLLQIAAVKPSEPKPPDEIQFFPGTERVTCLLDQPARGLFANRGERRMKGDGTRAKKGNCWHWLASQPAARALFET